MTLEQLKIEPFGVMAGSPPKYTEVVRMSEVQKLIDKAIRSERRRGDEKITGALVEMQKNIKKECPDCPFFNKPVYEI